MNTRLSTLGLPLSLAAGLASACSSSYIPRQQQGRIAIAMKSGQFAYHREGRVYEHGFMGGGLVDAVRGVPRAESAANQYHKRSIWGLVGVIAGTLCTSTALAVAIDNPGKESSALTTSLLCLGVTLAGAGVAISAVPYQYDAINLFNDAYPPTGPVYLPGQAPRPPGRY